jgi:hypothetical protein
MLDLDMVPKLESLHTNAVPESLHLEYKASQAIKNTDGVRSEISRDISAMANADGGQIIYGMKENGNLPNGLDGGIDPTPYDGLWLEQVIQQNVSPKIVGLKILLVPKGDGKHYFVVSVPKSTTVHQAKDGRYYRRRNFRIDIMEDYEIREAMNRNVAPELHLSVVLRPDPFVLKFQSGSDHSEPVVLSFHIVNRSNVPALYTVVDLRLEQSLKITSTGVFQGPDRYLDENNRSFHLLVKKLVVPHDFPVFREVPFSLNERAFHVAFPALPDGKRATYQLIALTRTLGSSVEERWQFIQLNSEVTLEQIS